MQPQMSRVTTAGQVDVAALAFGLACRPQRRPVDPVGGALHVERAAPGAALPVNDEPAVLVLAAEVEGDPLRCRGGRAAPTCCGRRVAHVPRPVTGRSTRCLHARRPGEREILEAQLRDGDRAAATGSGDDRNLDRAELTHWPAARGPPRKGDLRAADAERLPRAWKLEGV